MTTHYDEDDTVSRRAAGGSGLTTVGAWFLKPIIATGLGSMHLGVAVEQKQTFNISVTKQALHPHPHSTLKPGTFRPRARAALYSLPIRAWTRLPYRCLAIRARLSWWLELWGRGIESLNMRHFLTSSVQRRQAEDGACHAYAADSQSTRL